MSSGAGWTDLTVRSRLDWPLAGMVLALHAALFWWLWQTPQPVQRLDFGSPVTVRFIQAPPAPKPTAPPPAPEAKPLPKIKPVPKPQPKPKPRVAQRPKPVKPSAPEKKPLITQTQPQPVPMDAVPPAPKPPPQLAVQPKPAPPVVSTLEQSPQPPHSVATVNKAKAAPITLPNVLAAYRDNPPPVYPRRSRRLGEEGEVMLRVHITASGHVDQIKVQYSSGHLTLDRAALQAVRDWRFAPAHRGEHPIAAWVLVPIQFKLG